MAANEEFPRGSVITSMGGAQASVTLPACPGIAHVIDGFDTEFVANTAAGAISLFEQIQVSSTSITVVIGEYIANCAAGVGCDVTEGASGLNLACAPGEAVQIGITSAAPANSNTGLRVFFHDI